MSFPTEDRREGADNPLVRRVVEAFSQEGSLSDEPPHAAKDFIVVRAPGRVNLIGEHTDYNDGYVLPAAIDRGIAIVGRARPDNEVHLYSLDFSQASIFSLAAIAPSDEEPWSNYIRGVTDIMQREGYSVGGFEAVVAGDVPLGSGLSSSAALEVATVTFLDALFDLGIDAVDRAVIGQRAENEFVGVACGIMDQFISSAGKAGHALFLDCRTLEYEHVPLDLSGASLMVVNTKKQRGLVDSEYNTRRRECEEGARILSQHIAGVKALRDVTPEQFEAHKHELPPVIKKRSRHVVYECARVLDSVAALNSGDLARFGTLMNQSHDSLRDDFAVSCKELDAVVDIARSVAGVWGARMTGAGFGGSAVIVVKDEAVDTLARAIRDQYPRMTGLTPEIFVFDVVDGAGVVPI